jgi:PLD-like domain
MTRRVIRKSSRYCDREAADLVQSLFAVELVSPSRTLWLASAWISDIPVLDNLAENFAGIDASWGPRQVRLSEVLVSLAARGSDVVVVTNQDDANWSFHERVRSRAVAAGAMSRLHLTQQVDLHAKGLLGDDFHLHGSMNFTHNGLRVLAEELVIELDRDHVERTRIDYRNFFGPGEQPT